MKSLGEQLQQYRIDHNWTQQQLADKLAVSRSTISSWESGKSFPDLACLVSLSRLFDVPLEKLFSKDPSVIKTIAHEQQQNRLKGYLILGLLTVIFFLIGGLALTYQGTNVANIVSAHEVAVTQIPQNKQDQWVPITFTDTDSQTVPYLSTRAFLGIQKVVNASETDTVDIRITRLSDNQQIGEYTLKPNAAHDLPKLQRNEKYFVEIRSTAETCVLNFVS